MQVPEGAFQARARRERNHATQECGAAVQLEGELVVAGDVRGVHARGAVAGAPDLFASETDGKGFVVLAKRRVVERTHA